MKDKNFIVNNFADFTDVQVKKNLDFVSCWWCLELATSAIVVQGI